MPTGTDHAHEAPPGKPGAPARRTWLVVPGLVLAALLLASGGYVWLTTSPPPGVTAGAIGGPFALTDGAGRKVTDRDFRGRYLLVYFGYTSCPDACPTTLNQMAAALDQLGAKAAQVQPLFITVDLRRDTPAVIGPYAAAFSPRILGLTGAPDAVAQVIREYRVYANASGGPRADYTVDHSSILYLMGPEGGFLAAIPASASGEAIAAEIARQLPE
jgi:cytochrome oxidase Cu insertion factor (SCO1/SenC/PrrC family)